MSPTLNLRQAARVIRLMGAWLLLILVCLAPGRAAVAQQQRPNALTDAELEKIREYANVPNYRVTLFQKFMQQRIEDMQKINAAKRVNDRGGQLHDLMEQFSSLADELDDNLDEYDTRHEDVRKALAKLIEASAGWAGVLSQPSDDPAYNVSRKIALEAANDLHETAAKMLEDQKAWFVAHPPEKPQANEPIVIPR